MRMHFHKIGLTAFFSGRVQSLAVCQLNYASTAPLDLRKTIRNSKPDGERVQTKILRLNLSPNQESKARFRSSRTFFGTYIALIFPATTFALGCWQWKRHKWKTELIEKREMERKAAIERGEPSGGQEKALWNQHFSYMVQWFALTLALIGMWMLQFF